MPAGTLPWMPGWRLFGEPNVHCAPTGSDATRRGCRKPFTPGRSAQACALRRPWCLAASGRLIRGKNRLDLGDVFKRSVNRALVRDFKETGLLFVGQIPL